MFSSRSLRRLAILCSLMLLSITQGCASTQSHHQPMIAAHAPHGIKLDGQLDEAIWQRAIAYPLVIYDKVNHPNFPLQEPGVIRFAWDRTHLYIAGDFQDSDVVDDATADHDMLYRFADTMEIFVKADDQPWYWEYYATPRGYKASIFYPSRGRYMLLPMPYDRRSKIAVAGHVRGSVSNWSDRDQGFSIEVAIPWSELSRNGQSPLPIAPPSLPSPGIATAAPSTWRIMVGRYNYSAHHNTFQAELSATNHFDYTSFHAFENWRPLQLGR